MQRNPSEEPRYPCPCVRNPDSSQCGSHGIPLRLYPEILAFRSHEILVVRSQINLLYKSPRILALKKPRQPRVEEAKVSLC
jgi:hypothetical protein